MKEIYVWKSRNIDKIDIAALFQSELPGFNLKIDNWDLPSEDWIADKLVDARFINELSPTIRGNLIKIEKNMLQNRTLLQSVLYHGFIFQEICKDVISKKTGFNKNTLNIIITDRLLATPESGGGLPHIRVVILGQPALISVKGIINGPAKSREYFRGENDTEYIKDLQDSRIPQILMGTILQSIIYYFAGEAFCDNKNCRLYNAHWQRDMINAQVKSRKLCIKHEKSFRNIL